MSEAGIRDAGEPHGVGGAELGPIVLGLRQAGGAQDELSQDARAQRLALAAAALGLLPNPLDSSGQATGLEHRIVARAREVRPPALRRRLRPSAARRIALALLLVGAFTAAGVFAWLAFEPRDPINGQAVDLSGDGQTGVLLPRYEQRPFALVFWGLPQPDDGQVWQLWLVRESGEVAPGPSFAPDSEGRAAVALNPNTLETGDPPIGFAVSLDIPSERAGETPPREAIHYQFPLD